MKGFLTAWGMFTILPAPIVKDVDRKTARGAVLAFPLVGLVLGLMAAGLGLAVLTLEAGGFLATVAGLGFLVVATGAMHIDGVADTADGLGSRKSVVETLAVMKRSDIGPMGVIAIVMIMLAEVAALNSPRLSTASNGLPGVLAVLICMPMVARLAAPSAAGTWIECARPGGFGSLFSKIVSWWELLIVGVGVLLLCCGIGFLFNGLHAMITLGSATVIAWVVGQLWQRRVIKKVGGITGDVIGSVIETTALTFALCCALTW